MLSRNHIQTSILGHPVLSRVHKMVLEAFYRQLGQKKWITSIALLRALLQKWPHFTFFQHFAAFAFFGLISSAIKSIYPNYAETIC